MSVKFLGWVFCVMALTGYIAGCAGLVPGYSEKVQEKNAVIASQQSQIDDLKEQKQAALIASAKSDAEKAVAVAEFAKLPANTPPEVSANFQNLIAALGAKTAATRAEAEAADAARAQVQASQTKEKQDLADYKLASAGQAASAGSGIASQVPGVGTIIASILGTLGIAIGAISNAKANKVEKTAAVAAVAPSRAQPEVDQQWDIISDLRAQVAHLQGTQGKPMTVAPIAPIVPVAPIRS